MIYRKLRQNDYDLLKEFLYEAIYIPEGVDPPDKGIVEQPELALYYDGFGSGKADHCIVAEDAGKVVGAVWTRIMDDYGHVDDDTPSFAISLLKEYRSMGIGTQLMKKMLLQLKECGFEKKYWIGDKDFEVSRIAWSDDANTLDIQFKNKIQQPIFIYKASDMASVKTPEDFAKVLGIRVEDFKNYGFDINDPIFKERKGE